MSNWNNRFRLLRSTALTLLIYLNSDLDIHDKPVAPRNPNSLKLEQKYQIVRTARSSKSFEHRTESAQNSTKQDFSIGSNSTAIVHSSDVIDDKKEVIIVCVCTCYLKCTFLYFYVTIGNFPI